MGHLDAALVDRSTDKNCRARMSECTFEEGMLTPEDDEKV